MTPSRPAYASGGFHGHNAGDPRRTPRPADVMAPSYYALWETAYVVMITSVAPVRLVASELIARRTGTTWM